MSKKYYSQLYYHFVWSTYKREATIAFCWEHRLYGYIFEKCNQLKTIPIVIGGTVDHLHLLVRTYPDIILCDLIGQIKGSSSHFVNEKRFTQNRFFWQDGYGVFSVSQKDVKMITNYIRNQKQHHCNNSIIDEFETIEISDLVIFDISDKSA